MELPTAGSFATANKPIRQAIRQGNIVEAIRLLRQTGAPEGRAFQKRLLEAKKKFDSGGSSLEEWGREQVHICSDILKLFWMKEHAPSRLPNPADKLHLQQLLHLRHTEQALTYCGDFGDEYLLLETLLVLARKQSETGLMEYEYWEAAKSRVNTELQELLAQTADPPPETGWKRKLLKLFACKRRV
ncbi:MAG TPA: hypothetical protein PLO67_06645 [Saprospiraceae bacterium]|nr:hypothetical protein [Saprospiraceae bacterium]HPI05919.1 hypothetical protein [Saprospiraceae bacterium]